MKAHLFLSLSLIFLVIHHLSTNPVLLFPRRGNIIKISFKRKRFDIHLKQKHVSSPFSIPY